jgi:hypothetical protein
MPNAAPGRPREDHGGAKQGNGRGRDTRIKRGDLPRRGTERACACVAATRIVVMVVEGSSGQQRVVDGWAGARKEKAWKHRHHPQYQQWGGTVLYNGKRDEDLT